MTAKERLQAAAVRMTGRTPCAMCLKGFDQKRKGHRFCSAKCQRNAKKTRELNMV